MAGGQTRFLVWAPKARRVRVHLLTQPDRYVRLRRCEGGYHAAAIDDVPVGTRYLYRLDDRVERPDPASRFQPLGVHGPSEVIDPTFDWHDAGWQRRELADYVLYELHVGTFSPAGSFAGVIGELDALADLGVTAIELMPVAQFSGSRNWGYDGVFPFAVQNSYGGPRELKRLVDACHARGLAVVLDVVYNHIGPEGNYLPDFGPYFSRRHHTPWGPAINFEERGSDQVRRFFIENAVRWIDQFHFDALRLDAIHAIVDQSADPFLAQLAERVHLLGAGGEAAAGSSQPERRPAWLIAETNRNDPRIFEPPIHGGYHLDAQWLDDFGRALEAYLTGQHDGFYADYGRLADVARAYAEGYVLVGQYSQYRRRHHGQPSSGVPPQRFFAYLQTHDQIGNRPLGDRLSSRLAWGPLKLAAAAQILSPYPPLVFMGEEYGEPAPFHYFVGHEDPHLVQRVCEGRRRDFIAWRQEPADPAAEDTFAASRLDRSLRHVGRHAVLWRYYRELLRLRREMPALCRSTREHSHVESDEDLQTLLWWSRVGQSQTLLVLAFANRPTELHAGQLAAAGQFASAGQFPAASNRSKRFDSTAAEWHVPTGGGQPSVASAPDVWQPGQPLVVPPHSATLYAWEA